MQRINDKMLELKEILPDTRESSVDKATILNQAIDYIKTLQVNHPADKKGQTDGFFRHLPFKCYLPEVASVKDLLKVCPWVASRVNSRTERVRLSYWLKLRP